VNVAPIALIGLALLGGAWFSTTWQGEVVQSVESLTVERVLPTRLIVPSLSIDTNIESVGFLPDGAMANPSGPESVAWFDLGPVPGEQGSAVIAGHFGWKGNTRAVFDDLSEMKVGEEIYVENEKGEVVVFVVRSVESYDDVEDAFDVFISNDGKAHLNLVTCAGEWNETLKTYSHRVVVFADGV
jgi:LPXTG-site transpeptidase (sortase) family protein